MSDYLLTVIENRVCTLTLNRPEVMNAINHAVFQQLESALDRLAQGEGDVACVILRGEGKAFSAGHDLKDIDSGAEEPHAGYEAAVLEKLANLPIPVIAQVHGYCFTGALEVALACDLIFVDAATKLADTHSKWGLSPLWGMTQRLPRRVGASCAKDMMFSSRLVDAAEALQIGLADRVFEVGALPAETQSYARVLAENSSHSHRVCKHIIEATDGLPLQEGLQYEYSNSPGACDDMKERVAKFTTRKGG